MNIVSLGKILIGVIGGGIGIYTSMKDADSDNKDLIIEDLANRYNELVDKINNGDLDDLEDVDFNDFDYDDDDDDDDEIDDNEDEDDEEEYTILYDEEDDNEELAYYPGKYVHTVQDIQTTLNKSYTDLEKYYREHDEEMPEIDDTTLTNINAYVGMLGTAYQLGYMDGLIYYKKKLEDDTKVLAKIKHIEDENMVTLMRDIKATLDMTCDFMNHMLVEEDDEEEEDSQEVDGIDNFVVPVHHKND